MKDQYVPSGFLVWPWKILNSTVNAMVAAGSLASAVFLSALFLNVVLRYVFSCPIFWLDEVVICLLVWYSALGTVTCYWFNDHAVINYFLKFFNRGAKIFLMFMPHVFVAVTSWLFIKGGMALFKLQLMQLPQGGLPFTRAYYYALPMVVMGVLLMVLSVYRMVEFLVTPKEIFLERFQKLQDEGGMIIE